MKHVKNPTELQWGSGLPMAKGLPNGTEILVWHHPADHCSPRVRITVAHVHNNMWIRSGHGGHLEADTVLYSAITYASTERFFPNLVELQAAHGTHKQLYRDKHENVWVYGSIKWDGYTFKQVLDTHGWCWAFSSPNQPEVLTPIWP